MQDFLTLHDLTPDELRHLLSVSRALRQERASGTMHQPILAGKAMAMLFEKPSLRTRVSFELAAAELGAKPVILGRDEVGLGQREAVKDVARVLDGMVHAIAARVFDHAHLAELAEYAKAPVINMLSDAAHPAQALADLLTLTDDFGDDLAGRHVAFIGDGNNVARSLALGCLMLGMRFTLAAPEGFQFDADFLCEARGLIEQHGGNLFITPDPDDAVKDADALYADTFVSMGQEDEKADRLKTFASYQIHEDLLAQAPDHAIVLHCLPAYRGIEITDAVMDGPQSRVFPQAHNRLHAQKGLLAVLLGGA